MKAVGFHLPIWSPDGKQLAITNRDGVVEIRDTATGARPHTLVGHNLELGRAAYSPDSKKLATAAKIARGGCEVRLWDMTAPARGSDADFRGRFAAPGRAGRVVPAPNGEAIGAVFWGCAVHVWDAGTGQLRVSLNGTTHDAARHRSPDGRQVAG